MLDRRRGLHFRLSELVPNTPRSRAREGVDLDRVVVRGRRDLTGGIERRVRDGQARLVLADHSRRAIFALTADLTQVPEAHVTVQRGRGDDVWV